MTEVCYVREKIVSDPSHQMYLCICLFVCLLFVFVWFS